MPSVSSASIVKRKEDWVPGSKSHSEKLVELGFEPKAALAFRLWWQKQHELECPLCPGLRWPLTP